MNFKKSLEELNLELKSNEKEILNTLEEEINLSFSKIKDFKLSSNLKPVYKSKTFLREDEVIQITDGVFDNAIKVEDNLVVVKNEK